MIKTIGLTLLVAVAALVIYAATRPDSFRVERSVVIKAAPDKVFALINDFHRWSEWSPWEKMDPAMKRIYEGPATGIGAIYAWEGNSKVGQGRMEIRESSVPTRIAIQLDFLKPFEAHNQAEFTLDSQGEVTTVRWAMTGPQPFIGKLMGVFFNMDQMIGQDFETGLSNLKALAEK